MQKQLLNFLIIFGLLLTNVLSRELEHTCQHEENKELYEQSLITVDETEDEGHMRRRHLATQQPIRLTFDTSSFSQLTSQERAFMNKQIQVAKEFFADKLLQVPYPYGALKFPQSYTNCIDYKVSQVDKDVGIQNTDFHIYVTFDNAPSASWVANAGSCVLKGASNKWRPVFGRMKYNIGKIRSKDLSRNIIFEDVLETTLHEITHALGFSTNLFKYFIDPNTGYSYSKAGKSAPTVTETIRGFKSTYLATANVKQAAREHFNCPSAKGMLLENQQSNGFGSHWERTVLANEFMTASTISTDASYSIFTFALLEDSGWYTPSYEDLDDMDWGANRGCSFINGNCNYSFPEFTKAAAPLCTYYGAGMGYSKAGSYSDNCSYVHMYGNRLCYDENNDYSTSKYYADYFGEGSKCFESSVMLDGHKSKDPVRCHKYECKGSQVHIIIDNEYYPCTRTKCDIYKKGKNQRYVGTVTAPRDQSAFCNTYPRPCEKFCSGNGYCSNNECHCNQGWAGSACNVKCAGEGVLNKNGQCTNKTYCTAGRLHRANKTCV